MAGKNSRIPSYRLHKPSGQAVVRIDGRDRYLGKHGSSASREQYDRLIAEWLTSGRPAIESPRGPSTRPGVTIDELILAYWRHATGHYRGPDGVPTRELDNIRDALRPVRKAYGTSPAAYFRPLALRSVRDVMTRLGLSRTTINARVNRIRRAFRWAVGVELIPPDVHQALQAVEGLRPHRSDAREPDPVAPVAPEVVEATLPYLPGPVGAMVQLQLLTGMRAGEVMAMRGSEIDRDGQTWVYRPGRHKSAWRGRGRAIPLGPKSRVIVEAWWSNDLEAYLFSPRAAVRAHHARRSAVRSTKPTPSESARRRPEPGSGRGDCYDRRTYRQSIVRACRRAGVPAWSPLQLRHTAATRIRSLYGLEAAQVVLCHARPETTLIYAERDLDRARAVLEEIG